MLNCPKLPPFYFSIQSGQNVIVYTVSHTPPPKRSLENLRVNQIGEWLNHFLAQTWLQWTKGTKLKTRYQKSYKVKRTWEFNALYDNYLAW